jgi:hypothetical protein
VKSTIKYLKEKFIAYLKILRIFDQDEVKIQNSFWKKKIAERLSSLKTIGGQDFTKTIT